MFIAAAILLFTSPFHTSSGHEIGASIHDQTPAPAPICITEQSRQHILDQTTRYLQDHPAALSTLPPMQTRDAAPALYTFFPQAGILWQDLFIGNYLDLDPTEAIGDFRCGTASYNGHSGIDCSISSFGKQEIGVPIYAAIDGVVTATHDGEFDQNTEWTGQPANYVALTHADGRRTLYYHMKKNSVAVTLGQAVVAGQQIGLTGSSGVSTGPHLHFETIQNGTSIEPFAGSCRPGLSLWKDQPEYSTDLHVTEFTVTDSLSGWAGAPYESTRNSYVETGIQHIEFWVLLKNTAADNIRNTRFLRPDGSVRFDLGTKTFTGPDRRGTRTYNYNINFDVPGEWTIEYTVNSMVILAPLTVVTAGAPRPNRNPYPVTLGISPAEPQPDEVISARITNWNVIDDPDYDLLRYQYVWKLNGDIVRDVTSAALSDYIPRTLALPGAQLECTVTVTDGNGGSAPPATAQAIVASPSTVPEWGLY